jgi:hypothetical protein
MKLKAFKIGLLISTIALSSIAFTKDVDYDVIYKEDVAKVMSWSDIKIDLGGEMLVGARIQDGDVGSVYGLIKRGVISNDNGLMDFAVLTSLRQNKLAVFEMLINSGANINSGQSFGKTDEIIPWLVFASLLENERFVEVLINKGVDTSFEVNTGDKTASGMSMLLISANISLELKKRILSLFASQGGDINYVDSNGWSIAHNIIDDSKLSDDETLFIIEVIKPLGADLSPKTEAGIKAVYLAKRSEKDKTAELLLK